MHDDLVVEKTAPQEVEGLVIRFDPTRGLLADYFPKRTAFTDEALHLAETHKGAIRFKAPAKIGTVVELDLANGEAKYELVDRMHLAGSNKSGFLAEFKCGKQKIAGRSTEVQTFESADSLGRAGWPLYAGITQAFLKSHGVSCTKHIIVCDLAGEHAEYLAGMPHPYVRGGYIVERIKLVTRSGAVVTLPTAQLQSRSVA